MMLGYEFQVLLEWLVDELDNKWQGPTWVVFCARECFSVQGKAASDLALHFVLLIKLASKTSYSREIE